MSDDPAARGKQWLEQLLTLMSCPASIQALTPEQSDQSSQWLEIEQQSLNEHQLATLLGQDGDTLDAIQYLANTLLNLQLQESEQCAYTIELAGHRLRRQAELQQMAEAAVLRVRESSEAYEMPELSSAERRQVHMLLKDYPDLETFSQGREPDRRLVVRLRQKS